MPEDASVTRGDARIGHVHGDRFLLVLVRGGFRRRSPVHERANPAAGRIGRIQIKRRRRYLIPERLDREDGAEPAGGAEQIPVADFVDAGTASEQGYGLIWFR